MCMRLVALVVIGGARRASASSGMGIALETLAAEGGGVGHE